MFNKAKTFRDASITEANNWDEFVELLDEKGGFISAHWDGTAETEETIKEKTKATIRCIPLNNKLEEGNCILYGQAINSKGIVCKGLLIIIRFVLYLYQPKSILSWKKINHRCSS